MSSRSQLTKDLNESVKSLLGKRIKILLKNVVKYETKADKTENRVLVFSPCRLFLLTAKVPTRIDTHCHYLEIQAIESKKLNQLCLTINEKLYTFYTTDECGSQEVDNMIHALYTAIHNIFPSIPLSYVIRRIEVSPQSRVDYLEEEEERWSGGGVEGRGVGPCGGFSSQYACMCDYHSLPYREEVAWDVDTIYLSHDTRELCLRDFDYLDPKDLVPIISALEYNTWFTKLRTSHTKLTHEAIERLLHVLKKSLSLEELYLDNLAVKWDFAQKLSLSLIANGSTVLNTIDLSCNLIEDKGAGILCGFIAKVSRGASHVKSPISRVPKGLLHLNVAQCGLTSKGVNALAHSLSLNKSTPDTLTHLNLSGNNLKEDITNLCNFLAQPNVISHLDISKTDCALEAIFGALLRGCSTNLVHLNVSHNLFNIKKTKELPPSFKQFFTSSLSLKYVNMSFCKLPLDALKNLLLGLACNEIAVDVSLDISCNNLGSQGAHVLESCIHGVRSISTLKITENNMDAELASVITAVSKNKSIKHLHMGRNIAYVKAKHVSSIVESLVQMIQEEDCVLQTLSIPDCKLKSDIYSLINALGANQSLTTLDFCGNQMGDAGARLLGKALQVNTHLSTITYDRNNVTLQGYADLAYALQSNRTMKYMPVPLYDVSPCMKINAEKMESLMRNIQEILRRNISPVRYSNGHAFRLQQGFLMSDTQQMVDKLVTQIQEMLKETTSANRCAEHAEYASLILQDADNCKHLLSYLHDVMMKREQNAGVNVVDLKLKNLAHELHSTVVNYLQDTMETIIETAEMKCPIVFENQKFRSEIRSSCGMKNHLEAEFIRSCIVDQAGTQILNKINDLNLGVAAHVSDKVTDEIVESLSKCYKIMSNGGSKKRSSTPDVLKSNSYSSSAESSTLQYSDSFSSQMNSDCSPIATTELGNEARKYERWTRTRMRPKSVVDHQEQTSADRIPDLLPPLHSSADESLNSISEFARSTSHQQQLLHLAKSRPKRNKTRAPSRCHPRSYDDLDDSTLTNTNTNTTLNTLSPSHSPSSSDSISSILTDTTPNQTSPQSNLDIQLDENDQHHNYSSNHNSLPKKNRIRGEEADDVLNSNRSKSTDNLPKCSSAALLSSLAHAQQNDTVKSSDNRLSLEMQKIIEQREQVNSSSNNNCPGTSRPNSSSSSSSINRIYENIDFISSTNKILLKSPQFKHISTDLTDSSESKSNSSTPKPRRWSMADANNKNENNDTKTVRSSKTESTTIAAVHEPIFEPDNPPAEKKSVRELAESLVKQTTASESKSTKCELGFHLFRMPPQQQRHQQQQQ